MDMQDTKDRKELHPGSGRAMSREGPTRALDEANNPCVKVVTLVGIFFFL